MTREEYAELVEYIEDRWGAIDSWANAHRLTVDFDPLPKKLVWEVLMRRLRGDEEEARWPPKPAELIAGTRARLRQLIEPTPALPETTETYSWAEFFERYFGGEPFSAVEAMKRKSEELGRGR